MLLDIACSITFLFENFKCELSNHLLWERGHDLKYVIVPGHSMYKVKI